MNMEEARLYCLKLERDRERSWRESRQGAFEASMLSLDEHVAKFDDPGKIATFSDGGKDAEAVRSCGEDLRSGVVAPAVKKRMLNRLRKHPHLQKALRRLIANATGGKRKPVKKTHIEWMGNGWGGTLGEVAVLAGIGVDLCLKSRMAGILVETSQKMDKLQFCACLERAGPI